MAGHETELAAIARNTRQTADDTERQVRIHTALLEDAVGRHREVLGLPADPASDAIWASRITVGSHTLTDAKERLSAAVSERA